VIGNERLRSIVGRRIGEMARLRPVTWVPSKPQNPSSLQAKEFALHDEKLFSKHALDRRAASAGAGGKALIGPCSNGPPILPGPQNKRDHVNEEVQQPKRNCSNGNYNPSSYFFP